MPDFFDRNGWQPAGPTTKVSVTSTPSAGAAIPKNADGADYQTKLRVLVNNISTAKQVCIEFGRNSSVSASASTSMPLLTPGVEVIRVPPLTTHFSVVTDAGTADVYLTAGNGD